MEKIRWPAKTRELHNHHFDSTIWNDFSFRDDDIVIATYAKSGTTWMQQIIAPAVRARPEPRSGRDVAVARPSRPAEGGQAADGGGHDPPTVLEDTHPPGRPGLLAHREVCIHRTRRTRRRVEHNHHANANQLWCEALNNTPGRVGPTHRAAVRRRPYLLPRLDGPQRPSFWPFRENVRTWWKFSSPPERLVRALRGSQTRPSRDRCTAWRPSWDCRLNGGTGWSEIRKESDHD